MIDPVLVTERNFESGNKNKLLISTQSIKKYARDSKLCVTQNTKEDEVLASAGHILKLEQNREDLHDSYAQMTSKFMNYFLF